MAMSVGPRGGSNRRKFRPMADINVTPMVDVMLVLLVIFMVTIPIATSTIKLDMPPPNPDAGVMHLPVYISVMGPDALYIGSHRTSFAMLDIDLRAALQSAHPLAERVLIRGDKNVQYADFMQVLNALRQHGYSRIGLITEDVN